MPTTNKRGSQPIAARILLTGFLGFILTGALLLMLPISNMQGLWTPFLTALYTSTSAVCVTGLIVVDTATYYTTFGKVVIMLLIQLGGLGYAVAYSIIIMALRRKMTRHDQDTIRSGMNLPHLGLHRQIIKLVLISTACFELLGVLLVMPAFIAYRGGGAGVFDALFQAVSAFNNAGFATFSDNLMSFSANPWVGLVLPTLVIIGGIGVYVQADLWERYVTRKKQGLSLHTMIVLRATLLLVLGGIVLSLLFEWHNPQTLGPNGLGEKLLNAYSMSVYPRTCGFNTIDYAKILPATYWMTVLFMFIGASPGGTGGGIKTTTATLALLATLNTFRSRTATVLHGRKIPAKALLNAYALVTIWVTLIIGGSIAMKYFDPGKDFLKLVFEATSALGTVGNSQGITAFLSAPSKIICIFLMIAGRVGPITVGSIAFRQAPPDIVHHPVEDVLVG
jgi:trk system potassium uptake protein TrkH